MSHLIFSQLAILIFFFLASCNCKDQQPSSLLPGKEENGFHTSQLSDVVSAAIYDFTQDGTEYEELYAKYLGQKRKLSVVDNLGRWISPEDIKKNSTLDRVLQRGVLRIGYVNNPPYVYFDELGNRIGFEYELANQLLKHIQKRFPAYPLKIEWVEVDYQMSDDGQENMVMFDRVYEELQKDSFDLAMSGMISKPGRDVATSSPTMDFFWGVAYTGKDNLNLSYLKSTDRATFIEYLIKHPGMSLVGTEGGPTEDILRGIVEKVAKERGEAIGIYLSVSEIKRAIMNQEVHFSIGDGIAISSFTNQKGIPGMNLDISLREGKSYYIAPFTALDL